MLKELALKYYEGGYDLNCAETILYAANDQYHLELSKDALKIMAAFGGGVAVEELCGAAAGAAAVIGVLYTNLRGHESPRVKELTNEFMVSFKKRLGTYNCKELKEKYKNDTDRCKEMIIAAAEGLEVIINREGKR